MSLYVRLV